MIHVGLPDDVHKVNAVPAALADIVHIDGQKILIHVISSLLIGIIDYTTNRERVQFDAEMFSLYDEPGGANMRRVTGVILCAFLIMTMVYAKGDDSVGILYQISGGKNPATILGSIHVGTEEMYPFGKAVQNAI